MSFAIRVDNLGKRYRLGATHAGSIRELVNQTWKRLMRRRETLLPHEHAQLRELTGAKVEEDGSFWALRDLSFEVQPGEVVGIIGRNGSGKSTLLKILSQITSPTTGRVEIHGRVASLLEVGTGFHPELSGRENVFLNGAILGMTKPEIRRKFDEIVAFAEIEKFIDTPVKRYSSGMYVRLAFAVAAHLEPEIMIVDEVLAVGDMSFQKKCLGKIEEVSKTQGRTVLFVSHNMTAVRVLCSRAIMLVEGVVHRDDKSDATVMAYLKQQDENVAMRCWTSKEAPSQQGVRLRSVKVLNQENSVSTTFSFKEEIIVEYEYELTESVRGLRHGFILSASDGTMIFGTNDFGPWTEEERHPGIYYSRCRVPGNLLNSGDYQITVDADLPPYTGIMLYHLEGCLRFSVYDPDGYAYQFYRTPGHCRPIVSWKTDRKDTAKAM